MKTQTDLKKFKSVGYTNIQGRGDMFFVNNDINRPPLRNFEDLVNKQVSIDDKVYIVMGVESFAKTEVYKGETIGLLVTYIASG